MDGEMLTDTDCEGYARELAGEAYERIREIGELDLREPLRASGSESICFGSRGIFPPPSGC